MTPDDRPVRGKPDLEGALARVLEESGVSQGTVGDWFDKTQQTVSTWTIRGTPGRPSIDELYAIEDHLGLAHGYILRLAGYVVDTKTVRDVIRGDPLLSRGDIEYLLDVYDGLVKRAGSRRRSNVESKSRRTNKT